MPYVHDDAGDLPAPGRVREGGLFAPDFRPADSRSGELDQDNRKNQPGAKRFGKAGPTSTAGPGVNVTADDFRRLALQRREEFAVERERHRAEETERRRNAARLLVHRHVTDQEWNRLLDGARDAAERGEVEFLLLRFPSELCSDGGRAINVPDPEWPLTLRGKAAELYVRWERQLRPRRFHLAARVLEFPNGVPGDIGLFLMWAG